MAAFCAVIGEGGGGDVRGVGGGAVGVDGGGFAKPHGQGWQDGHQPTTGDSKFYLLMTIGRSSIQWELECH